MPKFMAVCSTGLGSSFMVRMNIEEALKNLGADDIEVSHADLGSVAQGDADVFFVGRDIAEAAQHLGDVVALNSIIDKDELAEKVAQAVERVR